MRLSGLPSTRTRWAPPRRKIKMNPKLRFRPLRSVRSAALVAPLGSPPAAVSPQLCGSNDTRSRPQRGHRVSGQLQPGLRGARVQRRLPFRRARALPAPRGQRGAVRYRGTAARPCRHSQHRQRDRSRTLGSPGVPLSTSLGRAGECDVPPSTRRDLRPHSSKTLARACSTTAVLMARTGCWREARPRSRWSGSSAARAGRASLSTPASGAKPRPRTE